MPTTTNDLRRRMIPNDGRKRAVAVDGSIQHTKGLVETFGIKKKLSSEVTLCSKYHTEPQKKQKKKKPHSKPHTRSQMCSSINIQSKLSHITDSR